MAGGEERMVNELVKYGPELDTIPLRKFTPSEMNLFFSIVSRMRQQGTQQVVFPFSTLRELSQYKATANERFIDDISRTYEHLLQLHFGSRSKDGLTRNMFVMFTDFEVHGESEEPYVLVSMHKKAVPLVNDLDKWVRYSLEEFSNLKSGYSKTAYRWSKHFRTTGLVKFTMNELYEYFDIPASYRKRTSNLDTRVFRPIREELSPIFPGFKITKHYSKKRGHKLESVSFTFKREQSIHNEWKKSEYWERQSKVNALKHNENLTEEEHDRQMDRIDGLPLGTTHVNRHKRKKDVYRKSKETATSESSNHDLASKLNERLKKL